MRPADFTPQYFHIVFRNTFLFKLQYPSGFFQSGPTFRGNAASFHTAGPELPFAPRVPVLLC